MNNSCNASTSLFRATAAAVTLAVVAMMSALLGPGANAAQTDISSSPLASTTSAQVKPNIMLLMDASGSMGWSHMPDEVEGEHAVGVGYVGYKSAQCNVLYYNPAQTYLSPKKADGSLFVTTPNFFAAPYAGFVSYYVTSDAVDRSSTNLSTGFQAYDSKTLRNSGTSDTPQQAYYYVYSGTQKLTYATAPCTDPDTGFVNGVPKATTGGTWTRVVVSTAADQANFAIWYSYYRTRIGLIKSAASLAFTPLTDTFRIGFLTMQPKDLASDSTINPSKYLAISDFNSTQRNLWFNRLFSQIPGGASPAREGLARVGRMYAGQHDGINAGMPDDPVQYSCQQNFTIMTTDGYWNSTTESPGGGPVAIDGTTLVGQRDGTLTLDAGMTPRPIWDGTSDGTAQIDNYTNQYSYAACGSFAYRSTSQGVQSTLQATLSTTQATQSTSQQLQSTRQNLATTTQNLQNTSQNLQSTSQNLQSTSQLLKSTNQNRQSTTQTTQSTAQNLQSTVQNRQSTVQNLQTTSQAVKTTSQVTQTLTILKQSTTQNRQTTVQNLQSTTQTTVSTLQNRASTSQLLMSTNQNLQSTTQTLKATSQNVQNTVQNLQSTNQNRQSTSQTTLSTSQINQSTLQIQKSTSQFTTTTVQVQKATTQTASCDARTELCTFVAPGSCTTSTYITCDTTTTGPTLVASCTPVAATAANNYLQTTCSSSGTGPTGTASCTPAAASSTNSYTTTSCSVVATSATPVASCTPLTASAGNNYTTTSCANATTGPTPVASCVPAGPNSANTYTATSCNTVVTGPAGVASCSAASPSAGNNYTTSTCGTTNTLNVPVASCAAAGPTSGNGFTTVTCPAAVQTTNVPVASCTVVAASAGNAYTATTCPAPVTTSNVPVAACAAAAATSSNNYIATSCGTVATGPAGSGTCVAATASSGNNFTTTTCTANNALNVPVVTCTGSGPTAANGYVTTSCPSALVTTDIPAASCTTAAALASNAYKSATCRTATTTNVPVATCTPSSAGSANNYIGTICSPLSTGPTGVSSCTPVSASSSNNYTATICGSAGTTNVAVASCAASGPTSANSFTTTTCSTNNTTNAPTAACVVSGPTSGNGYTTTSCPAPVVTTNVPVASCVAAPASSGNSYTATTCASTVTGPTVVASCTPVTASSSNGYQSTTCGSIVNTTPSGSCVASGPTAGNGYTTTTCPAPITISNVPVASCAPVAASAGNNWTTTTCPAPVVTTNVPVATCTPASATSGNSFTAVTCPAALTTTNVAVATCAPAAAASGNSFVATTCTVASTGPIGVSTCAPVAASSGNSYVATTCSTNNSANVPVASCSPSGPVSGNNFTTTTCPAPIVNANIAVVNCTAVVADAGNFYVTTSCPAPVTSANVPIASCTPSAAGAGNNFVTTTCSNANTGAVGVASCTPALPSAANNYIATTCATASTGPTGVASCTPVGPGSANGYTTTTCGTNNTTNVPAGGCTPGGAGSGNAWTTTSCNTLTTGPTLVAGASCVDAAASSGNSFTATTCASAQGKKAQYTTTYTVTKQLYSGSIKVGAPSVTSTSAGATDVDGACYQPGAAPGQPGTEPNPPVVPNPEPLPAPPASCASTGWPCTITSTNASGSTNSLADVAQYYYVTDLRPGAAWPDNVPAVGTGPQDDRVRWQHMTTFAIGLGVSGTLNYRSDYLSAPDGDFAGIRTGISTTNADGTPSAIAWPLWPDPAIDYTKLENWNNPKSIDDFWHAAVNGRGKYFSAGNPTSVVAGLSGALVGIEARLAAGAAAGVSSLQPVAGDNRIFIGRYTTSDWTGDIQAYEIDLTSGVPGTSALWSAQALLDTKVKPACDNRTVYLMRAGATNNMVNFTWNSQTCDGSGAPAGAADTGLNATEMAFFSSANAQLLSQWTNMSVTQQGAAPGSNLVNFLRGQRGLEGFVANDATRLYRTRKHVFGDVVNAQPVYVKGPVLGYEDPGYQQFKLDRSVRTPMIYSGANDGMLHAFYAGTGPSDPLGGQEAWALIPSTVLPKLFRLADDNYRNIHQYSVDGTPVVADVHDRSAAAWKTVLVAGLNAGGKGYYAVDVTDPAAPKALWEFNWSATCYDGSPATASADCHLGYTFGKPVVTKLGDGSGTWVVMFTSGYNNVNAPASAGDGQGYLYVLNAITGQIISKTSTGAGSAGTPSGLAQINNFVDNGAVDNTTLRVYGGDLLGNVWRFSGFNGVAAPSATLLGTAKDAVGAAQPITVRPELAELNGKPMVMVGTGELLGASDIGNLQKQSVYGIVDQLTVPSTGGSVYTDLRATLKPLVMTLSGDGQSRTVACTVGSPNCTSTNGWFVDFANDGSGSAVGERVNLDMKLAGGTLVVGSNVPQSSACTTGGYSWISYLNYASGLAVTSSPGAVVSELVSANSLLVGFTVIRLPSGQYRAISRVADQGSSVGIGSGKSVTEGSVVTRVWVDPLPPSGKRISWREIAR